MHFNKIYGIGREKFHHIFTLLTISIQSKVYNCYLKALVWGTSLSFLPTIVSGCSECVLSVADETFTSTHTKTMKVSLPTAKGSTLDILIFNDDALKRLDSYQRIERFDGTTLHSTSTGGGKIIFLYMGSRSDRYRWAEINSYGALDKICCNLEDENRESPLMTGICRCDAGEADIDINLIPLASTVILESVRCDFSGTVYSGKTISDAKVYLTNVNAVSSIGENSASQTKLINAGMLNPYDVKAFRDKSLIYQELASGIGNDNTRPHKSFLCYPCGDGTDRRTRLVIEGKIDGQTYYWPIEIGDGNGIERSTIYTYDILIRRKGTSDPDILIETQDISLTLNTQAWTEKENYPVKF